MYKLWYDYIKPKYQNNVTQCYIDTDSFIIHIQTEDIAKDIANDIKKWFDISNYSEGDKRPLPRGINKKFIGLMKDELGGKIIIEFVALRPKSYSYLTDDDTVHKKAKGTKRFVIKQVLKFNDYKDCLLKNKSILESQQRFKSETHNVYTEQINKIALSTNDYKRLKTFDKIMSYTYGTNDFKVCKSEMLSKHK